SGWVDLSHDHVGALVTSPRWNSVTPPQLARNTPVLNDVHPVQIRLCPGLRDKCQAPVLNNMSRGHGDLRDFNKPLLRQKGLNHCSASGAKSHFILVGFDFQKST